MFDRRANIRRFLFQTTLGSGAVGGFPPFAPDARGSEFPVPLPVLAISRGRDADKVAEPVGGVLDPADGLSVPLDAGFAEALAARKVLLTDTALNVAGFLTDEAVRPCPLSPSLLFDPSPLDASVSDPPLTLTSVELSWSSTVRCLFSIPSVAAVPFTVAKSWSTL